MNKKHKKVLRRTCSFILTMVLLFSVSITAMARSFEDVTDYSREYQDAISFVADNGYMVGVDEDSFLPEGKFRGMVVTLLHNMAGKPECSNTIPFTDVTTSDWFYNGVRWAYANGLVSGNGVDKFAPNDNIKKQDATLILYKYAIYCGMDVDDTCSLSGCNRFFSI